MLALGANGYRNGAAFRVGRREFGAHATPCYHARSGAADPHNAGRDQGARPGCEGEAQDDSTEARIQRPLFGRVHPLVIGNLLQAEALLA